MKIPRIRPAWLCVVTGLLLAPLSLPAAGGDEFAFEVADGAASVRIRGLFQVDSRWYVSSDGPASDDPLVLRRARISLDGKLGKALSFQFVPEFAGGSPSILDANITFAVSSSLRLQIGKFKPPAALEQLQSDACAYFTERAFPASLVPNRSIGAQLAGDLLNRRIGFAAGVFNRVADGASSDNAKFDDEKEFVGRIFVRPSVSSKESALRGLGVGVSGSLNLGSGDGARLTSGYRTPGQQRFFAYRSGTVADGDAWRLSPQAFLYRGPFGALAEYVVSVVNVRAGSSRSELRHDAWQLALGWVLTGEDASYAGVVPRRKFAPGAGEWGAFEIVARISSVAIDDAAFPVFANAATSAARADSFGLGLNWYPNKFLRASVNCFFTDFDTRSATPGAFLREGERAVFTRLQLVF